MNIHFKLTQQIKIKKFYRIANREDERKKSFSALNTVLITSCQIMQFFKKSYNKNKIFKGDGGVGTFDVGWGGPAFIFGSNLPIFWVHA